MWALACTVIEVARGVENDDDVFAAVHRIGYTDVVPELPRASCAHACREHRFLLASASSEDAKLANHDSFASPRSTLNDAAF